MKSPNKLLFFLLPAFVFAQNVRVDGTTYTPQQLVEDILINSTCINNVKVTNVLPGFHMVYIRDKNDCGVFEQLKALTSKFLIAMGSSFHNRIT